MTQQKGANVVLNIGEEDVAAGTVATAGFTVPFNSFNVQAKQNLITPATITGSRNPVEPISGNRDVSGGIVLPVDANAMWYWLQMMFGDPTTTGTGPYVHTFDIGSSQPAYSLETQFTDLATDIFYQYLGCKVNNWSMNLGGDGELVCNLDIVGMSESQAASSFDGSPTAVSIDRLDNFEASMTEGGGAISNVTEVSFAINFGLDTGVYVIGGSGVRAEPPEGIIGVSGSIKTLFEDDSLLDKAMNGTESSLIITIEKSASSKLVIEFNELQYARNTPAIPGPQGLLVELDFQAYYDDHGDGSAIVVALTNSTAHA